MTDYGACLIIYNAAADAEPTGDRRQWPDCLAFKFPVMDLRVLFRYLRLYDDDLIATVLPVTKDAKPDDTTLVANVITAATTAQHGRRIGAGGAASVPIVISSVPQ